MFTEEYCIFTASDVGTVADETIKYCSD